MIAPSSWYPALIPHVALALGLMAAPVQAATISGSFSVQVLLPNTLVNARDLDYGVILRPVAAGTVTMNPQTGVLTTTGGITPAGGTPTTGRFVGLGTPLRLVNLNGPTSIVLTRSGGAQTMTINQLRMSVNGGNPRPIAGNQALDSAGFITIDIAGRLNVGAAQAAGTYIGTYSIIANYQ